MKNALLVFLLVFLWGSLVSCSITETEKEEVYSNAQMGFSLSYPESWQVNESEGRVEFFYAGANLDSLERPTVTVTIVDDGLNEILTRYNTRNTIETEEFMFDSLFAFRAVYMDSSMVDAGHPVYQVQGIWIMVNAENLMRFVYRASVDNFPIYLERAERIIYSATFN